MGRWNSRSLLALFLILLYTIWVNQRPAHPLSWGGATAAEPMVVVLVERIVDGLAVFHHYGHPECIVPLKSVRLPHGQPSLWEGQWGRIPREDYISCSKGETLVLLFIYDAELTKARWQEVESRLALLRERIASRSEDDAAPAEDASSP